MITIKTSMAMEGKKPKRDDHDHDQKVGKGPFTRDHNHKKEAEAEATSHLRERTTRNDDTTSRRGRPLYGSIL